MTSENRSAIEGSTVPTRCNSSMEEAWRACTVSIRLSAGRSDPKNEPSGPFTRTETCCQGITLDRNQSLLLRSSRGGETKRYLISRTLEGGEADEDKNLNNSDNYLWADRGRALDRPDFERNRQRGLGKDCCRREVAPGKR